MELLNLPAVALATTLLGMTAVLLWRLRESRTALSAPRILLPPLAMSTGFLMFLAPDTRIAWSWALAAFLLGALVLSYPLMRVSVLTRVGDEIRLRRSPVLLLVLLGLAALRLLLRDYVDDVVSPLQTAGLFFILAFGMVLRWRAGMLRQYRALEAAAPRNMSS
jgi:membrane protein CcdC involved in cytochrome C biogenesis